MSYQNLHGYLEIKVAAYNSIRLTYVIYYKDKTVIINRNQIDPPSIDITIYTIVMDKHIRTDNHARTWKDIVVQTYDYFLQRLNNQRQIDFSFECSSSLEIVSIFHMLQKIIINSLQLIVHIVIFYFLDGTS